MRFKLQEYRKKAGFASAREFAEHIGMSVGTYTNYEQGKNKLTLEAAWKFADELGVSLDELAGREWPRPPTALAEDESRLLSLYRDTDQRGKAAIMRTAEGEAGMEGQAPPADVVA
ncbi:MAG: helix-turn-helix transcriptional regulator [Muribaculaceae bacterium]|nr:helix-turn-helix transcriptional regulator [Muribaculaceae bacterium]